MSSIVPALQQPHEEDPIHWSPRYVYFDAVPDADRHDKHPIYRRTPVD
jgi:hypothetical protein